MEDRRTKPCTQPSSLPSSASHLRHLRPTVFLLRALCVLCGEVLPQQTQRNKMEPHFVALIFQITRRFQSQRSVRAHETEPFSRVRALLELFAFPQRLAAQRLTPSAAEFFSTKLKKPRAPARSVARSRPAHIQNASRKVLDQIPRTSFVPRPASAPEPCSLQWVLYLPTLIFRSRFLRSFPGAPAFRSIRLV
jgi:hypothetical protein